METLFRDTRLRPKWAAAILMLVVVLLVVVCSLLFAGTLRPRVTVTLSSDRAGLVMESGAKVKLRGVQVGEVGTIAGDHDRVRLTLDLNPDQLHFIPANVEGRIRATTAFGAKYVDLVMPADPSDKHIAAGAVVQSLNVSTEVNTVFENLTGVLEQVQPEKLNSVLTALADGVRGQGERIGEATTGATQVLTALNARADTLRGDWRSLEAFSNAYGSAAPNIVRILDAATTTGATVTEQADDLDALLLNTIGLSNSAINLLAPNQQNLIDSVNILRPTTDLLMKYNPSYTCLLVGAKWWLDNGGYDAVGGNGYSDVADAALLWGKDPYRFPDNLPKVAAKGGPGGKPGCGSLPDASKNFPVRQLITNTGWGTGVDIRPNLGIGSPCYGNYLPVTRAVPEPPSIRQCLPGPAIGPVPYPGAPPYGAPLYGPGGVPLWPGIPPAPPPPPAPAPPPVAPAPVP
ncbi:MCE-family protein MCE3A [Mycobacterium sp. Root265]|uniref:MCE family protein n=1 Tax=Mycobacterium sp. Root265 TaxID=1736504 RepID=UPI00070CD9DD|nr:MCE family protein [Mycobacterium sp. Root265]KRD05727.1 MCE-family protein MCE3A [Mycobacterium sp. Root265]